MTEKEFDEFLQIAKKEADDYDSPWDILTKAENKVDYDFTVDNRFEKEDEIIHKIGEGAIEKEIIFKYMSYYISICYKEAPTERYEGMPTYPIIRRVKPKKVEKVEYVPIKE